MYEIRIKATCGCTIPTSSSLKGLKLLYLKMLGIVAGTGNVISNRSPCDVKVWQIRALHNMMTSLRKAHTGVFTNKPMGGAKGGDKFMD